MNIKLERTETVTVVKSRVGRKEGFRGESHWLWKACQYEGLRKRQLSLKRS